MLGMLEGPVEDLQARLDEAKDRFTAEFQVIDGAANSLQFPSASDLVAASARSTTQKFPLMMTAEVTAKVNGRSLAFKFPEGLGAVVLTTELPYQEPISEPVEPGQSSRALPLPTAEEVASLAASMGQAPPPSIVEKTESMPQPAVRSLWSRIIGRWIAASSIESVAQPVIRFDWPKAPVQSLARTAPPAPEPTAQPAPRFPSPRPWYLGAADYVKLGYTHILPHGLDHILFVIGLFLLSRKAKPLLTQITAFTIAHSLTLGLALYGVVRLPSQIVEPIIATSIAFVAIENLLKKEMTTWRPFVVFAFGLVHGLGFAGALQDAGLSRSNLLPALLGFNAGVELGQLSVVLLALLGFGWVRSEQRYRRFVTVPVSVGIAVLALFWTVERVLGS